MKKQLIYSLTALTLMSRPALAHAPEEVTPHTFYHDLLLLGAVLLGIGGLIYTLYNILLKPR